MIMMMVTADILSLFFMDANKIIFLTPVSTSLQCQALLDSGHVIQ
jgi:hypothetical protein